MTEIQKVTFPANSSAAAIDTTSSSYNLGTKLKGRTLVSTRFLVALALVVFHALLGTCPEAGAQTQNNVPVQNGSVFNPEGPAPLTGPSALAVSNDAPPNGTTAGAIEAIAVDPSHPGTIYVGSVNGGIWKTTNDGMNWMPLTDQKASLSIASLAFDPMDPTHQTLIAGIGITSNGGFGSLSLPAPVGSGGLRNGLLYSRDGGATWTRLGETTLSRQSVVGVAALGNTILAATFEPEVVSGTTGGLYRSTDSGATFRKVSGAPGSGLPKGPVSSLVSDPSNPNVFYAAITGDSGPSVWVSRNAGGTWEMRNNKLNEELIQLIPKGVKNNTFVRIAVGPNQMLALGLVDAKNNQLLGLFYSKDAGANWRLLPMQATPAIYPQGTNFALAIDPYNSSLVYVMGTNVSAKNDKLQAALAIYRVNAATNTFAKMSDDNGKGNTANGSWVHPDGRAFAFDVNGTLLTTTDTGLYARTNPQNSTGIWKNMLGNLSTSEIYSLAYDSNSKRLIVAMQDNTSGIQSAPGSSQFKPTATGGDGTNAVVNDVTLGSASAIYVSQQELGVLLRLIVDQTGRIISPGGEGGVRINFDLPVTRNAAFLSPFVLNNIDKTRIALAGSTDKKPAEGATPTPSPAPSPPKPPGRTVYVTQDTLTGRNGPTATTVKLDVTKVGDTNAQITAIDYGTRNNENALLAGGDATETSKGKGTLYLSTTALADSLKQLSAYSGLAPTSVKFDLRSDRRFFVADSVNLFDSFNQGMSFQRLTPNLPAKFIRPTSLAFIDSNGVDALFVGGLNNADNAGNPLVVADSKANGNLFGWRRFGSGLPNTTIYALSYNEKSDTLAVGTVGRGAYLLYDVTSNFASAKVLQFGLADNDSNPDPAILFGDRPLIKYGIGTLTINGSSTYTGGTLIENGTLVAGTLDAAQKISFALGTGSVFVQGGTLRAPSMDRLVINVGGNYTQAPGGTLALGVAGINGEDYDRVQVGRNASLNGTLALSSVSNFRPSNGDAFEFLLTNGIRNGEFARINDSLNNHPNLTRIDLYAANGVALLYLSAPTPRQPVVIVTPDLLPVVEPNAPLSLPISLLDPGTEQLTSVYEISFSGANMQRFNLEERLAEIRRGSTGFASNLKIYAPPAPYQEKSNMSADGSGKSVVEKQQALQPAPENRWGVWVSGWGDFVNVGDDNFPKGYDFTTGGVTVGIDYRFTNHLTLGFFGSYAHTWTDLQPGSIDVDTGRAGLYGTYFDRGFYLNGMVYGGYNADDTSRQALGFANGNSDGAEFSSFIGAGYDFHLGNFEIGPVASLQYTYASLNGFTEQGSLLPLQVHSDSEDSLRTDLGLRASYTWRFGRVLLIPSVTAAWEHEYKYSALPITVSAPVFGGETETSFGPSEGHDSAIINAGVGVQWTPRIATYVSYQGQLGRNRYNSNAVSGGVSFSF